MHLPSSHDEAHAAPDGPEGLAANCGADTRHQDSPRPNFARNLTRSFFVIGHKRCNSNDTNSMFEQATGELRATLLGNHSGISNGRTHRLERARRSGGPGCGADTRHQESPRPNFARNLTRSFFEIGQKRCNSNDTNSTFEQATGELRATLLGNHPDQRGGRTHRQAAPVTSRCTRYEAQHPIRRGALPTDRVQHPQSQEQTRKLRDADLGAVPVGGGRAWPGFEATRRAKLAARTARGRAATHGHTEQPGPHKQTTRHPEIRRGDKHRHQHPTTEAATGFPATASARSISATQRHSAKRHRRASATDQAVMST